MGKFFSNFCIQEFELYNQYCHTQRDTSESLPEDHSTTATAIEVVTSSMQPQNHDLKIRYALSLKMGVASVKSARIKSLQVYSYQDKGGFHLVAKIIRELKSHIIPYKFKCSHWLNLQHSDWRAIFHQ